MKKVSLKFFSTDEKLPEKKWKMFNYWWWFNISFINFGIFQET